MNHCKSLRKCLSYKKYSSELLTACPRGISALLLPNAFVTFEWTDNESTQSAPHDAKQRDHGKSVENDAKK